MSETPPGAYRSPLQALLGRTLPGLAEVGGYRRSWLRPDLLAGLTIWAVLVPQGLAYGELAGLSPVAGLYTALAAMLLYPLVGSSRYLNVGPESSIAIVTAAYVGGLAATPERAASLAALLSLVVAGFLILGALIRLAVVARLLSTPVLAGYLAGSAIVIGASQLGKIFAIPTTGSTWWRQVGEVLSRLGETNLRALIVGLGTILVVVALVRWAPRTPGILIAIIATSAAAVAVDWNDDVPVIGEVPSGVPQPTLPGAELGDVVDLLGAGASVALLVFASSLLTVLGAVVLVGAARMIDLTGLRRLWRVRRSDFALAAITFGGVLVVGVLPGIAVGVVVSLAEVLRRAVLPPTAVLGQIAGGSTWRDIEKHETAHTMPGLIVYRFDAPLFFANADVLRNEILRLVDSQAPTPVREVVLDAEGVVDLDITGAEALDELLDDLDQRGVRLGLARVRTSLRTTLARLGLEERIGADNFHLRVRDAAQAFARRSESGG